MNSSHGRPNGEPPLSRAQGPTDYSLRRYRTFSGTIVEGMDVISAEGKCLGRVDRVENDHIVLAPAPGDEGEEFFLPLSLIDGIHDMRVLLSGGDDERFGLGAEP